MISKKRISWLTSLPSPYWVPIWNSLSKNYALELYFTNSEVNQRGWLVPANVNWKFNFLSKKIFYFDQSQIIPSVFGFRKISFRSDVLVVGGGWEVPIHVFAMLYARLKCKQVYIISESVIESHRFSGPLARKIRYGVFNLATKVITVGNRSTKAVQATGIARQNIIQLFNPIDTEFVKAKKESKARDEFVGHRFIAVGRLIQLKNFEAVIRSFSMIASPNDRLTLVGEGPLRHYLEKLVSELNIQEKVLFTGHLTQQQLSNLYLKSCTLVLPSTNEVWGMVVTEALASGCHVVVSKNCGVSDFVQSMKGAYLSGTDVESIAIAMTQSKMDYYAPIENPEILKYTPQKFVLEICNLIEGNV